jgi:hypothetical protein
MAGVGFRREIGQRALRGPGPSPRKLLPRGPQPQNVILVPRAQAAQRQAWEEVAGASAHRNTQILSWVIAGSHPHVGLCPREQTDFRSWIERSTMPILRAAARSAISSIRISF